MSEAPDDPPRRQRLAAYVVLRRDGRTADTVLLTRIAGHLPGDLDAARRRDRPRREAGRRRCAARSTRSAASTARSASCSGVHDVHFSGTAPSGRHEDYHGVHLVFAATVVADAEPRVLEVGGTTDAVAWVPVADIEAGSVDVLDVVTHALTL